MRRPPTTPLQIKLSSSLQNRPNPSGSVMPGGDLDSDPSYAIRPLLLVQRIVLKNQPGNPKNQSSYCSLGLPSLCVILSFQE